MFDIQVLLESMPNPRSLDDLELEMMSIWYSELNPFSYSHQISNIPSHIKPTLAAPQGPSSAWQRWMLETCLGSVV